MQHPEDDSCILFWDWLNFQYQPYIRSWFHVPNGGRRNRREAARFKRMGVSAGVSDYICLCARRGYNGLALEMKAPPDCQSSVSDDQEKFLENAALEGHFAVVAKGFDEAKSAVEWYFGDSLVLDVYSWYEVTDL